MLVMPLSIAEHFKKLSHLLALEAKAEQEEALKALERNASGGVETSGNLITTLVIRDEEVGLGGRTLLTLAKRNQNLSLPWTRFRSGTPILLSEEDHSNGKKLYQNWRGVVTRMQSDQIQIALPDWPDEGNEFPLYRLERAGDEISRQRMQKGMDIAESARNSRLADLRDILLNICPACFHTTAYFEAFNPDLNKSQKEAIRFALSAEDLAILHGPPGTGKTTTLVELIRQLVHRDQRILAVAPSNMGVDNLLSQLLLSGEKALRMGHPARMMPGNRSVSLDEQVEHHPDMKMVQQLNREARQLQDQAARYTRAKPEPGMRNELRQEARSMLAEARKLEKQIMHRILDQAQIICATTTGLDPFMMEGQHFDWCIMDEASQGIEPVTWIPLQYTDRLVLAGDPYQLPPTVISQTAAKEGLSVSLMERLMLQLEKHVSRKLTVQYRMHQEIMNFSSQEFYENQLQADKTVENHLLSDLPGIETNDFTEAALHFIDTAGASYDEESDPNGESKYNVEEANLVLRKVQELLDAGVNPADLAIITPYSAQVRLLREKCADVMIEIDSVDGFQGREKEAIIVSLVRSNTENEIGFLEDIRRMNVALTRARRKLIVIGDSATITIHPFYQRMVTYFESIGAYHSVWEEQ
ncbi:MAG: AAA family ATPase [Anaerolineaceae bacterium]|nr:AAA family ATPase [Anaerolineaceae bacterium]